MKPLPELLQFSLPLRGVRMVAPLVDAEPGERLRELHDEVFERGRREGEKALSEQLIRQRSELLELQNGLLQSLRDLLPEVARECESALVALALEAAQKLVAGLPVSLEMVEATVKEALARVEETSELTILVNAEDLELLQRANSPLLLTDTSGERIRFRVAREVTRGGCIIQTRFGTIDARRETKVELLRRALEG
jgi:flagellar assembly protein FliH